MRSTPFRHLCVSGCFVFILLSVVLSGLEVQAAVYNGEVVEVSLKRKSIKVKYAGGKYKSFRVLGSTKITIQKKSGLLSEFSPGDKVSVFTTRSGRMTRLKKIESIGTTPEKTKPPRKETKPKESHTTTNAWTGFRGADRSNKSTETGLLSRWNENGPGLEWTATGLGQGYSSVVISNGMAYTMGNVNEKEMIHAIDMKDGKLAWSVVNSNNIYRNGQGNGPRGTPTIDGDKLYALGGNGDLSCIDLKTHKHIWRRNILKDFGGRNIQWGISESVLIDGDKLICTPGGKLATIVALDKNKGDVIWTSRIQGNPQASYASAIAIDVGKVRQYVTFVSTGVVGVRASDGQPLWGNDQSSNNTANCSAPVYESGMLFSASGYGKGGAMLQLSSRGNQTKAAFKYKTNKMRNHHGGMVVLDGHIYGSSDPGILTCIELKTGKIKWQDRSPGKGSLVYADGYLYCRSEGGPITLVEATPNGYNETGKFNQPKRDKRPAWAHPVVAEGKLFIRDMDKLLVFDIKKK